ncbi:MAG: NifX-associated nitrogen fixation protein [Thiotrichales bacterium]
MTSAALAEADPLFTSAYMQEMVRQMRGIDSYGTYDGWSPERVLALFVVSKGQRRQIPVIGDPDEETMARVKVFYNAIASLIEQECGLMAVPMVNLSHEGFGRAIITVGKLVVMDRTLRDVHRFGFESFSKMKDEGDKLLSVALEIIGKYPDVAGL